MVQHVGEQQREGLVADDVAGAPHGVAEAQRRLLAREARLAGPGAARRMSWSSSAFLPRGRQRVLQLELAVEVVLDDALVAPGDEDEVLDAGGAGLVHHVLDQGAVDDGEHLLGHRLGGGKKAGAEASHGEYGFANALGH